jgi:hypothetical protein
MNAAITDLAGYCHPQPHYFNNRTRINHLIDRYLSVPILNEHFANLPQQFTDPQPRPWQPIRWGAIHPEQIVGIKPELFLLVIAEAAEIEAPIRSHSQESWAYLHDIHPAMAHFMGGTPDREQQQPMTLGFGKRRNASIAQPLAKSTTNLRGTN